MGTTSCKHCAHKFTPGVGSEATLTKKTGAAVAAGLAIGGELGEGMGIAALGGAISGVLPVAIVVGIGAYLVKQALFKEVVCPSCSKPTPL